MKIKGFIGVSLVDWDGKVSSVIFLPGCNMRCPFCYNTKLVLHPNEATTIPLKEVKDYLKKNKGWVDGVVITGGEPTLQKDLPILCEEIKKLGLSVKVDTNGTNPDMTRKLIDNGFIDYVAMDIKAPLIENDYSRASGVNMKALLKNVEETISTLLVSGVEYEFRTTLVPTLHKARDIEKICEKIKGCRKYALQNFKADVEIIDPTFQNLKPFSKREVESFLRAAKTLIPNTVLRD
jgi:pyruvate formate lyase activating enzyme